jgi:hypothetical protein
MERLLTRALAHAACARPRAGVRSARAFGVSAGGMPARAMRPAALAPAAPPPGLAQRVALRVAAPRFGARGLR